MKRLFQCVSRRHSGGARLMDHNADPGSDQDLVDDNNNTDLALNLDLARPMDQVDDAPLTITVPPVVDGRGTDAARGVVVTADCAQVDITGRDGDGDVTLTGTGDREDTVSLKNPRCPTPTSRHVSCFALVNLAAFGNDDALLRFPPRLAVWSFAWHTTASVRLCVCACVCACVQVRVCP